MPPFADLTTGSTEYTMLPVIYTFNNTAQYSYNLGAYDTFRLDGSPDILIKNKTYTQLLLIIISNEPTQSI